MHIEIDVRLKLNLDDAQQRQIMFNEFSVATAKELSVAVSALLVEELNNDLENHNMVTLLDAKVVE